MALFELNNVSFLDTIHFDDIAIEAEKMTFVSGPSGSGKTTLLRLLNKSIKASSGDIYYKGKNIKEYDSIDYRRHVSLIAQSPYLFPGDINHNFNYYYEMRKEEKQAAVKQRYWLEFAQAPLDLRAEVSDLSGGEKQRVFLAIGLSFEPDVLLLDEPTAASDEKTARKIYENLKEYIEQEKKTIIVISHDLDLVKTYADDVIYLEKGDWR